jgi:hypothetical protein
MDADFPGYSKYTHSCWMRSTLVEAGLGQWLETPGSPLTSSLYDSRFSGG